MGEVYRPNIVTDDRYEVYLAEKVEEIRKICVREQIPCFMAFGVRAKGQTEEEYQMKTSTYLNENMENGDKCNIRTVAILPEVLPVAFEDRRFSDLVNVINHFRTVPASDYQAMSPEDVQEAPMGEEFKLSLFDAANPDATKEDRQKALIEMK